MSSWGIIALWIMSIPLVFPLVIITIGLTRLLVWWFRIKL